MTLALSRGATVALTAAIFAGLPACSGSGEAPTSAVPALPEGAYIVRVDGDSVPVGTALVDGTGRGYVLLSEDGEAPARIMHVTDRTDARRVPAAPGFVTLSFARTEALILAPLQGEALAGEYQVLLDGRPVGLAISSDGRVSTPGAGVCRLSGQVEATGGPGLARRLTLTLEACGALPTGTYRGVLFSSASTAPAAWQAVLENGTQVIDLLGYR